MAGARAHEDERDNALGVAEEHDAVAHEHHQDEALQHALQQHEGLEGRLQFVEARLLRVGLRVGVEVGSRLRVGGRGEG